ncbi:MAG: hypothetical protein QXN08_00135 [Nitrososphaerales archaeon]
MLRLRSVDFNIAEQAVYGFQRILLEDYLRLFHGWHPQYHGFFSRSAKGTLNEPEPT